MTRGIGVLAGIVLAVAGCSVVWVHQPSSTGVTTPGPTPARPPFGVDNELDIPVTLFTNGAEGMTVPPGTRLDFSGALFGPFPWTIEARSPSGRALLTLEVPAGSSISETSGVGARADLACGRLDLYAGPPMLGPVFVPDPSKPCS